MERNRSALRIPAAIMILIALSCAPLAAADPNNQSPSVLCRDADYADLHPTLCDGPFSLGGGGGHSGGGGGGILGGILRRIPGLGGLV